MGGGSGAAEASMPSPVSVPVGAMLPFRIARYNVSLPRTHSQERFYGRGKIVSRGVSGERNLRDFQAQAQKTEDPADSVEEPPARLAQVAKGGAARYA